MDSPRRELSGDFGSRQVGDLDIIEPSDSAPIIARPTRLDERQPRPQEEGLCILLKAALGRNGDDQWAVHDAPP